MAKQKAINYGWWGLNFLIVFLGALTIFFGDYALGVALMMAGFSLIVVQYNLVKTSENAERMNNIENILNEMKDQLNRIQGNPPVSPPAKPAETSEHNSDCSIMLPILHDRNKELASYIRLTDAAIWGFLTLVFLQLIISKSLNFWMKIFIFSLIWTAAVILWRYKVNRYQEHIVIGYQRIAFCEFQLNIPDAISVKYRLMRDYFPELLSISDKRMQFEELDKKFKNSEYHVKEHDFWNTLSIFFIIVGLIGIIVPLVRIHC